MLRYDGVYSPGSLVGGTVIILYPYTNPESKGPGLRFKNQPYTTPWHLFTENTHIHFPLELINSILLYDVVLFSILS